MGPTTGSQNYNSVGNDTRLKTRIVTISHLQCRPQTWGGAWDLKSGLMGL